MPPGGEKTEKPTPRKLREARKRGEVWRSRDLVSAAVLLAAAAVLGIHGPNMAASISELTTTLFGAALSPDPPPPTMVLEAAMSTSVSCLWPVLLAVALAAGLAGLATVRPLLTAKPLEPKAERLDPVQGLKRIFSGRGLFEAAIATVKVALVAVVVVWTTLSELRSLLALPTAEPGVAAAALGQLATTLLWRGALVLLGLAVVDVLYQRHRYMKDQRMTKQEVKQEQRETEGDQSQKGERRRLHQELLDEVMLTQVKNADVVIVNPEHIAVALRYAPDDEADAPEVVASGQHHLATRIIEVARRHGVPVMRDVELARSLVGLEVGARIPEELYEAVAAILRVVMDHVGDDG